MMFYYVIIGFFTLVGWLISNRLKSKFNHYAKVPIASGLSGAEVAKKMLSHYGVNDVRITQGNGFLTDHYNPTTKTVTLSPAVFTGRNISAAAVAAHECGHAVQHATAYSMLQTRSKLVPVVQFSSKMQQFLFFGFMISMSLSPFLGSMLMMALTATFGMTALFSMITLPVEFDASKRALVWLDQSGVAQGAEYDGAKDALWWAAMTYVASALSALVMFLYFLLQTLNSNR